MSNISVNTIEKKIIFNIKEYTTEIEYGNNFIKIFDNSLNIKDVDTNVNSISTSSPSRFDTANLKEVLFYLESNMYIFIYYFDQSCIDDICKYCNITIDNLEYDNGLILLHKKDKIYEVLIDTASNENINLKYNICTKKLSSFNVLSILDEFTYTCFKYECNLISIDLKNIENQIIEFKPDLFFCESVWRSIYTNLSLCDNNNSELIRRIISLCKLNSIPTVFWNKEDGINYNRFIDVAKLFDIILTTDERCIPQYIKDTKNENVYCLEFAAQPKIHNPLNNYRINDVFFAGKWYNNMKNRKYCIETLIDIPLFKNKIYKLDIYDRKYVNDVKSFPLKYNNYLKRKLNYTNLCNLSKHYKLMLNVNTITDSNTMFSRRVYEGLSTGCIVLSTYSKGIKKKFSDLVRITTSKKETEAYIIEILNNEDTFKTLSHKCYTSIIDVENYKHRFKKIMDIVGLEYNEQYRDIVNIILLVNKDDDIEEVIDFYNKNIVIQSYSNIIVTIFINNEEKISILEKEIIEDNVNVIHFKQKQYVIDKINIMENIYITVFNINDVYGADFIRDTLLAFLYIDTNTKMVGKKCYIDNNNDIHNDKYEHRYVEQLKRNSIIFAKNANQEVIDSIYNLDKFYSGECIKYSVEKWNYIADL
jgi:hypothetical protein